MPEDPQHAQKRKRASPDLIDAPECLDWGWLYCTIQEATESMFDALLNIVTREGYDAPAKHFVDLVAEFDPKSWCRKPIEGHTATDTEIYQVIRNCAKTMQSLSKTRATWSSVPSWVSILTRWLRICLNRRSPHTWVLLIFD